MNSQETASPHTKQAYVINGIDAPLRSTKLRTGRLSDFEIYLLASKVAELVTDLRDTVYLAGLNAEDADEVATEFSSVTFRGDNPRETIRHGANLLDMFSTVLSTLDYEWGREGYKG